MKRKTCLTFLELSDTSTRKPSFTSWRAWKTMMSLPVGCYKKTRSATSIYCVLQLTLKRIISKGPKNGQTLTHTSPLGVVTAVLRGSISSLMEERKFWEIRRAFCSSGKSGWSLGVCFSRSCTMNIYVTNKKTHWTSPQGTDMMNCTEMNPIRVLLGLFEHFPLLVVNEW